MAEVAGEMGVAGVTGVVEGVAATVGHTHLRHDTSSGSTIGASDCIRNGITVAGAFVHTMRRGEGAASLSKAT